MVSAVLAGSSRPSFGMRPNITRAEYERIDGANFSTLKFFEQSAAHAREAMRHPKPPTKAMEFGTAFHCAVLEPSRFSKEYAATPKIDRRTTEGKRAWAEFEAEHANATCLDADDFVKIQKMRDRAWTHPIAKQLLRGIGHNEVCAVWERDGQVCKGLIDRIGTFADWTWIVDLKKADNASKFWFSRSIKSLHYGAQAAFYFDGCNAVAPRPRRFAWIACEDAPPYEIAIYEADEEALHAGRVKYERWLWLLAEAKRTGIWAGYTTDIQPLSAEDTEWYG
jgi:hypothetical protein